jgi:RHS repeat-associated protein
MTATYEYDELRPMLISTASNPMNRFTSKERDAETGLDFFLARYYSGAQGRFLSVDPENAGAKHEDPQSWNAYAYARNNPLMYTDPSGLAYMVCLNGYGCDSNYPDAYFEHYFMGNSRLVLVGGAEAGNIFVEGNNVGSYIHLFKDPEYKRFDDKISLFLEDSSDRIQRQKEEDWYQRNYLGWAIDSVADLLWPENKLGVALFAAGPITEHGALRLAERGFTAAERIFVKTGTKMIQGDGATVFIKKVAGNKYHVLVEGAEGVVTGLKNLTKKEINALARSYGWR